MTEFRERLARANFATSIAPMTYPGYPDPTSDSGSAEVPAVMIGVDLTEREDVEYTAMLNSRVLIAKDAWHMARHRGHR